MRAGSTPIPAQRPQTARGYVLSQSGIAGVTHTYSHIATLPSVFCVVPACSPPPQTPFFFQNHHNNTTILPAAGTVPKHRYVSPALAATASGAQALAATDRRLRLTPKAIRWAWPDERDCMRFRRAAPGSIGRCAKRIAAALCETHRRCAASTSDRWASLQGGIDDQHLNALDVDVIAGQLREVTSGHSAHPAPHRPLSARTLTISRHASYRPALCRLGQRLVPCLPSSDRSLLAYRCHAVVWS